MISDHLSFEDSHAVYAEGTEFTIGRIEMVANTGTYLDTPGHRHRGGHDLSGLPLEKCALLPAVVVDGRRPARSGCRRSRASTWPVPRCWSAPAGTRTSAPSATASPTTRSSRPTRPPGWPTTGRCWSASTRSTSTRLPRAGDRPVHTLLLDREIPVVEHLTGLDQLPATGATFTAVPVKVAGLATFPVRAFAALPD